MLDAGTDYQQSRRYCVGSPSLLSPDPLTDSARVTVIVGPVNSRLKGSISSGPSSGTSAGLPVEALTKPAGLGTQAPRS